MIITVPYDKPPINPPLIVEHTESKETTRTDNPIIANADNEKYQSNPASSKASDFAFDESTRAGRRTRRKYQNHEDDFGDFDYRPHQRNSGSEGMGIASMILGIIAVLFLALACVTGGLTSCISVVLAIIGLSVGIYGKGNMKVAGIVLNLVALIPAVIVVILGIFAIGVFALRP